MKRTHGLAEVAEAMDVSESVVYSWCRRGLKFSKRGNARLFDLSEVAAWLKANGLTGRIGRPSCESSAQLLAAKLRKELALAERYERAVARERAALLDAAEVSRMNAAKFTAIRETFGALPASIARDLEGLNAPDIESRLEAAIHGALKQLSQR